MESEGNFGESEGNFLADMRSLTACFAGINGGWWCMACQQFVWLDVTIQTVPYHRVPKGLHQIRSIDALHRLPDSWLTAPSQATSATVAGLL